ncbi:MAG: GntR family transcriptional regulator [Methylophaga sp.]|nr:MAG: GntR family transcriptional regulator [Methylophaga sp.]
MSSITTAPVFKPLYEQIKISLTQSLISGEWKPGESIPSEMELAARFKVSQGTVRKAVDELAMENILIRRQGKGTFVATHNEEKSKLRFLRLTSSDGKTELLENQLLKCDQQQVDPKIAGLLNLKNWSEVIEIKRLLSFSQRPVILDHIIVPARDFPGLDSTKVEEYNGSLYSMYETLYGIPMVRAEEKLTAISANDEQAKLLNVSIGSPLLCIERIAYTYDDRPIEWRLGLCVTDDHHYMNELE